MERFLKNIEVLGDFQEKAFNNAYRRLKRQKEEGLRKNNTLGNFVVDIADDKIDFFKKTLEYSFGNFIELKVDSEGLLIPVELSSKTKIIYLDIVVLKKSLLKHEKTKDSEASIIDQLIILCNEGTFLVKDELIKCNDLYLILRVNKSLLQYSSEGFKPPFFAMFDAILTPNEFGVSVSSQKY